MPDWSPELSTVISSRTTRSMHTAIEDLGLRQLDVIHLGRDTYPLRDRIRAVSIFRLREDVPI